MYIHFDHGTSASGLKDIRQDYDLSATNILQETENAMKNCQSLNTPLAMNISKLNKGANKPLYCDQSADAAARNDWLQRLGRKWLVCGLS
jgi:hypothetical protein